MVQGVDPQTSCYAHFGPAPAADRLETYIDVITDWVESVGQKRSELEDDEAVIEHFVESSPVPDVGAV
jgi:hypothetical protein